MYKYNTVTVVTDNGPYITKLILKVPEEIRADTVSKDTFSVYVERKNKNTDEIFMASKTWMGPRIYPSKGYREVTAAYPCDAQGNPVDLSMNIALEMPYGPRYPLGYVQASFGMMNEFVKSDYRVTQVRDIAKDPPISGLVFEEFETDICEQLKGWKNSKSTYAPLSMGYGYFTPDFEELRKPAKGGGFPFAPPKKEIPDKNPLVIWLHGAGEGGNDPTVAYTGNKAVNLSSKDIQNKLGGAAWILVPQSPTIWMDNGTGTYTTDGKSMYTEALMACIEEFVDLHKEQIDTDRIIIGGCSNGGFMTMRMIIDYPTYFAAAYPVCEALFDNVISDEEIERIKYIPIWFTHAANDPVVSPAATVLPTYRRLKEAGGKKIFASYFDNIVDQTGLFKNEQGRPYEYMGHFSWIHTYNDFCTQDLDGTRVMVNGAPVTLWQWIGLQSK